MRYLLGLLIAVVLFVTIANDMARNYTAQSKSPPVMFAVTEENIDYAAVRSDRVQSPATNFNAGPASLNYISRKVPASRKGTSAGGISASRT